MKTNILNISFILIFLGGAVSYTEQKVGLYVGYLLTLSGIFLLTIKFSLISKYKSLLIIVYGIALIIFSLIPFLITQSTVVELGSVFQSILYSFIFILLILFGWRVLLADRDVLIKLVLIIATANGIFALLMIAGLVTKLPYKDVALGRYIFGTNIRSSSGLMFNVNYYSTVQAVCFFIYLWLNSLRNHKFSLGVILIAALLFMSNFLGSSRGVALGIFGALPFVFFGFYLKSKLSIKIILAMFFCIVSLLAFYFFTSNIEFLQEASRYERGLNSRDMIWAEAYNLWLKNPWFGYGDVDTFSRLTTVDIGGGSIQSGYYSLLLRGGVVSFTLTYVFILCAIFFKVGFNSERIYDNRWELAIVVFFLINTYVRTYNVGGLGLLPISFVIALSSLLFKDELKVKLDMKITQKA
ncbi:O-antigen ligase family protein [Oceanisphaera ostreae]|uniref:O-antigen ligase family protein n=1 Tax=Oceanisphaera ostreae TaxID=914151 RepID=A0ABW3KDV2_9GAMM